MGWGGVSRVWSGVVGQGAGLRGVKAAERDWVPGAEPPGSTTQTRMLTESK